MSLAKLAAGCAVSALALSACGTTAKPLAGTISASATRIGHAQIDDPRTKHVKCLLQHHVPVTETGHTWLAIGSAPGAPIVNFTPTPGAAQEAQISGHNQGAEVIGSALLYPRQAPDNLLQVVEDCLALGVKG